MQRREVNYRPTWDFRTNETVSGNYFPVNSAIAVVDPSTNMQMTVMNDRSQGGASLESGKIELMQNRRLYFDDDRGVGEALNETDGEGNGIVTHCSYHLQFFDRTKESSMQRSV